MDSDDEERVGSFDGASKREIERGAAQRCMPEGVCVDCLPPEADAEWETGVIMCSDANGTNV
jgi:hypothetical protein